MADPGDAGEILTLQRAANVTEARLYHDLNMPALVQTYAELVAELASSIVVTARSGHRMVGCGRARVDGPTLHIGRLVVAPDMQGKGIGTRLIEALERAAPPTVRRATLFTGHLSVANIRLYERLGFAETHREHITDATTLVHLDKPVDRQPT
jgi:GNAT superfamily N-acetyltransferase